VDLRIDETYIPDMNQRLTVYRRMAAVRTAADLDRLMDEVRDRYGAPPPSVLNLAEYASIRLLADGLRLESVDREGQLVVLKFRSDARLDPTWLLRVVQGRGDVALVPPATLKLDLRGALSSKKPARSTGASWWTARARAGEVAPGFSREEILKPAAEDPRGEDGVFGRVGGLLRELSAGGAIG
jgi:transcription-repair coupling factor (superfamily II helicase)